MTESLEFVFWVVLRVSRYNIPVVIPVTRGVKGYTRFYEKYVTGRRKRFPVRPSFSPFERRDLGHYKS